MGKKRPPATEAEPMAVGAARANLSEVINRILYWNERIPITRNGKVVAAIVSADDLKRLAKAT
jgi:prevent-host-death family protein